MSDTTSTHPGTLCGRSLINRRDINRRRRRRRRPPRFIRVRAESSDKNRKIRRANRPFRLFVINEIKAGNITCDIGRFSKWPEFRGGYKIPRPRCTNMPARRKERSEYIYVYIVYIGGERGRQRAREMCNCELYVPARRNKLVSNVFTTVLCRSQRAIPIPTTFRKNVSYRETLLNILRRCLFSLGTTV